MNACKPIARELNNKNKHEPRNIDYAIAAYTMTSFCLIRTGRLEEALKMVSEAEKLIFLQVKYCLEDSKPP